MVFLYKFVIKHLDCSNWNGGIWIETYHKTPQLRWIEIRSIWMETYHCLCYRFRLPHHCCKDFEKPVTWRWFCQPNLHFRFWRCMAPLPNRLPWKFCCCYCCRYHYRRRRRRCCCCRCWQWDCCCWCCCCWCCCWCCCCCWWCCWCCGDGVIVIVVEFVSRNMHQTRSKGLKHFCMSSLFYSIEWKWSLMKMRNEEVT